MFNADNFKILTADFREECIRRRNGNCQYVCVNLQEMIIPHWGDPKEWISPEVLTSVNDFYRDYLNHDNYISTVTNILVDWSVQKEYNERHALYIAFTEFIIENTEFEPENLGFWIGDRWEHPFGTVFHLEKAIYHYLAVLEMTPVQYFNRHPDSSLRTILIRLIGKAA